jgi:uncharacterized membrane protein YfcA
VLGGGRLLDGVVGGVAGLVGGISGLQGPVMVVWCGLRGWDPAEQRTTYQSFFIVTQSLMFALLWHAGIANWTHFRLVAMLAPVVVVASVAGVKISRRMGDQLFRKLLYGFVWLSGLTLLMPALRSLLP